MQITIQIDTQHLAPEDHAILDMMSTIGNKPTPPVPVPAASGPQIPPAPTAAPLMNLNLGAIDPQDNPEVGGRAMLVDMKEFNFGPGTAPLPVGAIPVQVAPPAPPAPPAPQYDSAGTPWSSEIHSNPAQVKDNGEWRAKRGVDKTFAANKAEELRRIAGVQPTATHVPPAPPPAPVQPPAPPSLFVQFMQQITPAMVGGGQGGIMTDADVEYCARQTGLYDAQGVGKVIMLKQREDLIPHFAQLFQQRFNDRVAGRPLAA